MRQNPIVPYLLRYPRSVLCATLGAVWKCAECGRAFGKRNQSHDCAPPLDAEAFFDGSPDFEREIVTEAIEFMCSLDGAIHHEFLSIGVFFKYETAFVQLRTMRRWVAVCFNLNRVLHHERIARKVVEHSGRFYHVVNVRHISEIDEQLRGWLAEAYADELDRAGL